MTKTATPHAEPVALADLRPHPRNYRAHPADQIEHLAASISEHGFYRNIVAARDGTILAGHGVALAAQALGMTAVPVVRLDIDPADPAALKVLTGDNEIEHLAEQDDRALSELLREIKERDDEGLLGTGYDEMMLANLAMVTRPASEIADFDAAAEWAGMPEYDAGEVPPIITVKFANEDDRAAFAEHIGATVIDKRSASKWSIWWPERERQDLASVRFEG